MVELLREGHHYEIVDYRSKFFKALDLAFLSDDERSMVKQHLLAEIYSDKFNDDLGSALEGIGQFLTDNELTRVIEELAKVMAYSKISNYRESAEHLIFNIYSDCEESRERLITKKLDYWITKLTERGLSARAVAIQQLKEALEIPF